MEKVLKNRFKQLISGKNQFIPNLSKLFPQGFTQLIFYKKIYQSNIYDGYQHFHKFNITKKQ